MKKNLIYLGLVLLTIIIGIGAIRFLSGNEDTWLCIDGQWVKHGNPSASMPTGGCGEKKENNQNAEKEEKKDIEPVCASSTPETCPENCIVCPPCPECSSISCQTEEFCQNIGFDKNWYENIKDKKTTYKTDEMELDGIYPGMIISSPFTLKGKLLGNWYFEAVFPIKLVDANNNLIIQTFGTAQSEWMTEKLVPFAAELKFETPKTDTGTLIIMNDNPSGLPENQKVEMINVNFK